MSEPEFRIKYSTNDVVIPQGFLTRDAFSVYDENDNRLMVVNYDEEEQYFLSQINYFFEPLYLLQVPHFYLTLPF